MNHKAHQKNPTLIYLILSVLFVITVQQFDLYKGNANHLIHSIKFFENNKLQNDWIAQQENHLPLFSYFNYLLIKLFSKKGIYILHSILLGICPFFLFLISKILFPKIEKINFCIIWFAMFVFIFHENSFFSGVAGQSVIDAGYQPASFGTLIFIGIYLFLIKKNFLSVFFICLAASFHPTYVLHTGFLILGFITYLIISKKYFDFFTTIIFYIILILPITIFIIFNFIMIDKNLVLIGQKILLERIPHHANIHHWVTYKDIISLLTYFIALFLVRNNFKFFVIFSVFGFCSIFLSFAQYFLISNSLALAFPWRSSVFIIPVSSLIIVSYFINKIKFDDKKLRFFSLGLIIITSLSFGLKSHYIKDLNSKFDQKLKLAKDIKKNFTSIERILVPTHLHYIRMNTGLPIFIDWKHHAFRYDQLIEWNLRVNLADNFYGSETFEDQLASLKKIQEIEYNSHILIKKDRLKVECNDLINHEVFMLINVKECYPG